MKTSMARAAVASVLLALGSQVGAESGLKPQTSAEGGVTVRATPLAVGDADAIWRFQLSLDTHTVNLTQDLTQLAVLVDPSGKSYPATAWDGDPPGSHHRQGVLSFDPIKPRPAAVTLRIRGIGATPERNFSWSLDGAK